MLNKVTEAKKAAEANFIARRELEILEKVTASSKLNFVLGAA